MPHSLVSCLHLVRGGLQPTLQLGKHCKQPQTVPIFQDVHAAAIYPSSLQVLIGTCLQHSEPLSFVKFGPQFIDCIHSPHERRAPLQYSNCADPESLKQQRLATAWHQLEKERFT
jgi:hypothetical protein